MRISWKVLKKLLEWLTNNEWIGGKCVPAFHSKLNFKTETT